MNFSLYAAERLKISNGAIGILIYKNYRQIKKLWLFEIGSPQSTDSLWKLHVGYYDYKPTELYTKLQHKVIIIGTI